MQINMTTFAVRKKHYIHDTLKSLFDSDWVDSGGTLNLMLGSEDDSHVRQYADHPSIRIVPWDVETNPSLRQNCTLNKIRALRYGEEEVMLFCEDDIHFECDWLTLLREAMAELPEPRYVLSLFAARHLLAKSSFIDGKTWIKEYPTSALQGAQGVLFPSRAVRLEASNFLKKNIARGCGDDLMGRYARQYAALYATREPLVNHVGAVSCFHAK